MGPLKPRVMWIAGAGVLLLVAVYAAARLLAPQAVSRYAALLAAIGLGASPAAHAPADQLPSLRLVRTLPAPNPRMPAGLFETFQSGTGELAWSPDGQRLATYIRYGHAIQVWSPDGSVQYELPRYSNDLGSDVLRFLSGHRQLIAGPTAETNSGEDRGKVDDVAFSVLDAETGKVLKHVPGPNPGKRSPYNMVTKMAASPDERFVAVVFNSSLADRSGNIAIYSTTSWERVATIERPRSPRNKTQGPDLEPRGLAFSPDGASLAVLDALHGRVLLYDCATWTLVRSFEAYPEDLPPMTVISPSALAFSPDSTMIAIASSGGAWWTYPGGQPAPKGSGTLVDEFPAEPLRIVRLADGERVASLGRFASSFLDHTLIWTRADNMLVFVDGYGDIRLWRPFGGGEAIVAAELGRHIHNLAIAPDGSQLAANIVDGAKIFDIVHHQQGNER